MEYVLHIERSEFFGKIVKKIVQDQGLSVLHAKSAEEAYTLLKENDISLIISGIELDGSSGTSFIEELSTSEYSSIPVIVVTSSESLELREKLFSLGIADYILKKDITTNRLQLYFQALIGQNRLMEQIRDVPIAVLDDSRLGLTVIRNIFSMNRVKNVTCYNNPLELLENIDKYSIFVVDMVLPEVSGEEVILKIREKSHDSIIIVVSGITNIKLISHALMYGADDYITKPFDNTIFMARLKSNARAFFLNRQLKLQAITDGLTGLYNHRYIYSAVDDHISAADAGGSPFCVLLMDIDHFKNVNDTYGHPVGDLVLKGVAEVFKSELPESSVTGRYGGEEFLIILPETELKKGIAYAENMREKVEAAEYTGHPDLKVTISGGLVQYTGSSTAALIKEADELLYQSKKKGRNRITTPSS